MNTSLPSSILLLPSVLKNKRKREEEKENPEQEQNKKIKEEKEEVERTGISLAIVGYRNFTDYPRLKQEINTWLTKELGNPVIEQVISGGCKGTDQMGEKWAKEHSYKMVVFHPDWEKYPFITHRYTAFTVRDKEIAEKCTHLIAFPSLSKGRGTQKTIEFAKEYNKIIKVIEIYKEKQE